MRSFLSASPGTPRIVLPSTRQIAQSRRDFLAWLGAGTALTAFGCATSSEIEEAESPDGVRGDDEGRARAVLRARLAAAAAPDREGR
jgi:hypothetical protein